MSRAKFSALDPLYRRWFLWQLVHPVSRVGKPTFCIGTRTSMAAALVTKLFARDPWRLLLRRRALTVQTKVVLVLQQRLALLRVRKTALLVLALTTKATALRSKLAT